MHLLTRAFLIGVGIEVAMCFAMGIGYGMCGPQDGLLGMIGEAAVLTHLPGMTISEVVRATSGDWPTVGIVLASQVVLWTAIVYGLLRLQQAAKRESE